MHRLQGRNAAVTGEEACQTVAVDEREEILRTAVAVDLLVLWIAPDAVVNLGHSAVDLDASDVDDGLLNDPQPFCEVG